MRSKPCTLRRCRARYVPGLLVRRRGRLVVLPVRPPGPRSRAITAASVYEQLLSGARPDPCALAARMTLAPRLRHVRRAELCVGVLVKAGLVPEEALPC